MKTHTLESIKARCTVDGPCWIWPTTGKPRRRPQAPTVKHEGKQTYVRRLARMLADRKPVPRNREVVTHCDNLRCVSPECSFKVTGKRRRQIRMERGRFVNAATIAKGIATVHARSKFSEHVIQLARTSTGSLREVGAALGMHPTTVHYVRKGTLRMAANNPFAGLQRCNAATSAGGAAA